MLKSLFALFGSGNPKNKSRTHLGDLPGSALDAVLEHSDLRYKSVVGRCSKSLRDHVSKHLQDAIFNRRTTAAKRIQRFWRWFRYFGSTRIVFKRYREAGLTRDNMLTIRYMDFENGFVHPRKLTYICLQSFDRIKTLLREDAVFEAASGFLRRVNTLCRSFHKGGELGRVKIGPLRVFLSNYMIVYHAEQVLAPSVLADAVRKSSTNLISLVDEFIAHVEETGHFQGIPAQKARQFHALMDAYIKSWNAWKAPDEQRVITMCLSNLNALMAVVANAETVSGAAEDGALEANLAFQVNGLRTKVRTLSPTSLQEFDSTLAVGLPWRERPRFFGWAVRMLTRVFGLAAVEARAGMLGAWDRLINRVRPVVFLGFRFFWARMDQIPFIVPHGDE
jgi:hypothetical protein